MRTAPLNQDRPRILLVDDNRHGLAARRSLLEELGYEIVTAENGQEALSQYAGKKFDLVVTDFKMPGMDGTVLIQRIRACEPGARIILLSGFVEPLGLNEQSTGADVVIAKSAGEVGHLVRSVGRLLSGRVPRKPVTSQRSTYRRHKAG